MYINVCVYISDFLNMNCDIVTYVDLCLKLAGPFYGNFMRQILCQTIGSRG